MKYIKLSIERFWIEPGNFELWCEMLSRIPRRTEACSIKEIAKLYLGKDVAEKDKKLDRSKELFGLHGYEYTESPQTFEIKGVYFLTRMDDGCFVRTKEANELVAAYEENNNWEVLLARQLLRYSPRTRVIVYLLCNGGYFETGGQSFEQLSKWKLIFEESVYYPFSSNPAINDMNVLLHTYKDEALGEDWRKILLQCACALEEDWAFVGSTGSEPAKTNLSSFMRAPMQLFQYLDWFLETNVGILVFNKEKAFEDMGPGSLFTIADAQSISEIEWLKQKIQEECDGRGFIAVEPVLQGLMERFYPAWEQGLARFVDYYITHGVREDLFYIAEYESGQPRHGRGYLGKREYQLLKLEFNR
jgi:hypothetical protein